MSGQIPEGDPIELAVRLSEEIDAEDLQETVAGTDRELAHFLGDNLTADTFSPNVEAATDAVIAYHGQRIPASAAQAMMRGAERVLEARRADIAAEECYPVL